ncbi:MAG: acyl-CoA reductase [Candidatus Gastranaerophilaceae bacterium]
MKNVNYIIGSEDILTKPMAPYSDMVCEFLNEVSSKLMKSPMIRTYTDLSALAFWCRKGNIQKLKEKFGENSNRLGRGLCLHIAPSNIPINSVFSYFFSLLAGNANIVRLSSKDFPQVDFVCKLIKEVLQNYPEIEKRTVFVKYDRNDEISSDFSKKSDCRMIWGGDKTISIFKKYETKPRCTDITFPDRYSICIIDAKAVEDADETKMKRLAESFYVDTYLMDQNACSSPQSIYWLNDLKSAREKFWNYVYDYAKDKYVLQDAVAVDKYTKFCEDAIIFDNLGETSIRTNLLYRSEIKSLNADMTQIRGKGGYFYEYSLSDLEDLFATVTEKYQTVTYFGIDSKFLVEQVVKHELTGIDRIVPIGKAMDINVIWDGHDLVRELSRVIGVE